MTEAERPARRIRPILLVLLWAWAIVIFTVLDLFLNVNEFDGIRPRAPLYRGMRAVAHEIVGEPLYGGGIEHRDALFHEVPPDARRLRVSHDVAGVVTSRHAGEKPDLRTPQGERLFSDLCRAARTASERSQREGALRSLRVMFGADAGSTFVEVASDEEQPLSVRSLARQLADKSSRPTTNHGSGRE